MYKFGSAGQKLWAEIPICTCNTAVGVRGYVWCLNLVTASITVSPVLKAPQVTPIPWQSLWGARKGVQRVVLGCSCCCCHFVHLFGYCLCSFGMWWWWCCCCCMYAHPLHSVHPPCPPFVFPCASAPTLTFVCLSLPSPRLSSYT